MTPEPKTCTHPVGPDDHPCRRLAVAVYLYNGDLLYKCRIHDAKVRATAEEKDVERQELVAA